MFRYRLSQAPVLLLMLTPLVVSANFPKARYSSTEAYAYIDKYKSMAVAEMYKSGIPASVKLAQAILESECGKSTLAQNSNNHFGIKCRENWTGKTYYQIDDEKDKKGNLVPSCFRVYSSIDSSYLDHTTFLSTRKYYTDLFTFHHTDYVAWCRGLKKASYATASDYDKRLIAIIEQFRLYLLDQMQAQPFQPLKGKKPGFLVNNTPAAEANNENGPLDLPTVEATEHKQEILAPDIHPVAEPIVDIQVPDAAHPPVPVPQKEAPIEFAPTPNDPFSACQMPVIRDDSLVATFLGEPIHKGKFVKNGLVAVSVQHRDNLFKIAERFDVNVGKLSKYNDLEIESHLRPGWIIYLEPKNGRKESEVAMHAVRAGETLFEIAQKYALGPDQLRKWNGIGEAQEPKAGTVLHLTKKAPEAASTMTHGEKMLERKEALDRLFRIK